MQLSWQLVWGTPEKNLQLTVRVELPNDGLDDGGSGGHVPPANRHGYAQEHHYIFTNSLTALHVQPLTTRRTTDG